MRKAMKPVLTTAMWLCVAVLTLAPFALAVLFAVYGEFGLAAVIFGLALMQALVLVVVVSRPRAKRRRERNRLSAAE